MATRADQPMRARAALTRRGSPRSVQSMPFKRSTARLAGALDQGQQRGDVADDDEAIPQTAAGEEHVRERGRWLFPEVPHAIQIGRGIADTLAYFDPAI